MAEVARAIVDISEVPSPEQFTFILQNAVRPIIQLKVPQHLSAPTELRFEKERLTPEEMTEENCCNLILPQPFHPKFSTVNYKDPTRCLAGAAHFLIRKRLFNSKYTQLLVAKDFAVAEKKLHLALSGRKYDPGKKASKRKRTSEIKAEDPKPSTSQQQPQDAPSSEQHPQDEPVPEEPQDVSMSEQQPQEESTSEQQQQGVSAAEEQPQGMPEPDTLLSQPSSDDTLTLPDYAIALKIFLQKTPALYQRSLDTVQNHHNTSFNSILLSFILSFQSMQRKTNYFWTCNVFELSANIPKFIFSNIMLFHVSFSFKTDAVKALPQHYDLDIYFLFTAISQFNKYHFLLQYQSDIQLTTFCFSFPVCTNTFTILLTNCSCSSFVPVLIPVVPFIFLRLTLGLRTYFF